MSTIRYISHITRSLSPLRSISAHKSSLPRSSVTEPHFPVTPKIQIVLYSDQNRGKRSTMSASEVKLSLDDCGVFHLPNITSEAAAEASKVLQKNHDNNHIFFNQSGFHNHIAHHILTLYALGSSPDDIQRQYAPNKAMQRPQQPANDSVMKDLRDYKKFHDYLGNEKYYHDYLLFFQGEIEKKGYEEVINEYCLKGDERADDMLVRLHAGNCL